MCEEFFVDGMKVEIGVPKTFETLILEQRIPMQQHTPSPEFNLRDLLDGEFVVAHYQPIVSIGGKSIVGYESLTRGIHPISREMLAPGILFAAAYREGLPLELDRVCRKKALEYFRGIQAERPECFLSMNFESSVIDRGVVGSGHLINQVTSLGVNPGNVAVEIIESQVEDLTDLQKFVETYRAYGFLIALDDVGAGHSNLNRIPLIKPDILKIDRFLVQDIPTDFYKQEVFKSLVNLSEQIGALCIAEGIETKEEARVCMELGVDLLQGYYFGRPKRYDRLDDEAVQVPIRDLWGSYRESVIQKLHVKRFNLKKYELLTRDLQVELVKIKMEEYDQKLEELIHYFPQVEAVYVLNHNGTQITETIMGDRVAASRHRVLFHPRRRGSDHSLKDYFYMLVDGGLKKTTYVSEPYLSTSTGNLCVTFGRIFKGLEGHISVLCVDINTQFLKQLPGAS